MVLPTEIGTALLWGEVPSTYGFSSFTYTTAYNFCHTDIEQCIGSVFGKKPDEISVFAKLLEDFPEHLIPENTGN